MSFAALLFLSVLTAVGCGHKVCPGFCGGPISPTLAFECPPGEPVSIRVTGPCADVDDAGVARLPSQPDPFERSRGAAGTCHVEVAFASGFTWSTDITYAWQPNGDCCPPYLAPTQTSNGFVIPTPVCASDAGSGQFVTGDASADAAERDR